MNADISPDIRVWLKAATPIFIEEIFTVPEKVLASDIHASDALTQMGVGLEQDEGGFGGENDGISCVSI